MCIYLIFSCPWTASTQLPPWNFVRELVQNPFQSTSSSQPSCCSLNPWPSGYWLLPSTVFLPYLPAFATLAVTPFLVPRDSNNFEPWMLGSEVYAFACLASHHLPHILNFCCSEGALNTSGISQRFILWILLSKVSVSQNALGISFFFF